MAEGNEVLCQACGEHVPALLWRMHRAAHGAGLIQALPVVAAFERAMHAGCDNPRCPICALKPSGALEALALVLRGASQGGASLVLEGAWDELTSAQRERWLLFALRAWDAVLRLQSEAAGQ